jgi:hypothetical protein
MVLHVPCGGCRRNPPVAWRKVRAGGGVWVAEPGKQLCIRSAGLYRRLSPRRRVASDWGGDIGSIVKTHGAQLGILSQQNFAFGHRPCIYSWQWLRIQIRVRCQIF